MNRRLRFFTGFAILLLLGAFLLSACTPTIRLIGTWRIDPVRTRDWNNANIGVALPPRDNLGAAEDFTITFSSHTVSFLVYGTATPTFPDMQYKYTEKVRGARAVMISMVGADGQAKEEIFHFDDPDHNEMWMANPAFSTGPNNDVRIYFKRVTRPDQ